MTHISFAIFYIHLAQLAAKGTNTCITKNYLNKYYTIDGPNSLLHVNANREVTNENKPDLVHLSVVVTCEAHSFQMCQDVGHARM